jgi:hypothetical protein
MSKYLFIYHSGEAEKFRILLVGYRGSKRNFFSVKLFLSGFLGMPRNLMLIPTEVRKYGNKKFLTDGIP